MVGSPKREAQPDAMLVHCPRASIKILPAPQFPLAHGPVPPQRPHIPAGGDAVDRADSAPTAKTLSVLDVFVEPHLGHAIFSSPLIDFTSFSKGSRHFSHVYS